MLFLFVIDENANGVVIPHRNGNACLQTESPQFTSVNHDSRYTDSPIPSLRVYNVYLPPHTAAQNIPITSTGFTNFQLITEPFSPPRISTCDELIESQLSPLARVEGNSMATGKEFTPSIRKNNLCVAQRLLLPGLCLKL